MTIIHVLLEDSSQCGYCNMCVIVPLQFWHNTNSLWLCLFCPFESLTLKGAYVGKTIMTHGHLLRVAANCSKARGLNCDRYCISSSVEHWTGLGLYWIRAIAHFVAFGLEADCQSLQNLGTGADLD